MIGAMSQSESQTGVLTVDGSGESHIGGRAHNEDTVLVRPDLDLYLVADGAGGHNAGNIASTLAAATVARWFEQTRAEASTSAAFDQLGLPRAARRLAMAVQQANHEILCVQQASDQHQGMGTTIVALHAVPESRVVHIAHVGDSRCYRLRDGRLEQLTDDHTLVNDVLELHPDLDDQHAAELPRNVTTRALGMSERVRVAVRSLELVPADTYLLCTHGLWRTLEDLEIWHVLQQALSPREHVWTLLGRALAAKPTDNLALVVLSCDVTGSIEGLGAMAYGGPPRTRSSARRRRSGAPEGEPSSEEPPDLEILMLENEWTVPPDADGALLSVPAEPLPLREAAKRTIGRIVAPSPKRPAPPTSPTLPHIDVATCQNCGELVESANSYCPRCGCPR